MHIVYSAQKRNGFEERDLTFRTQVSLKITLFSTSTLINTSKLFYWTIEVDVQKKNQEKKKIKKFDDKNDFKIYIYNFFSVPEPQILYV
jgi:type II secretory pathway component PulC